MTFKFVIVGTGVAGLATGIALVGKGYHVTILEATPKLQAIGRIIVVQAKGNRMLDRLGVYKKFAEVCGTEPLPGGIRRYADGVPIRYREKNEFEKQWRYPYVELLSEISFLEC
jgi:2-polyprenyl-6-methoxyphenol hydroxylase-like FAD-dependent oxidoreductase